MSDVWLRRLVGSPIPLMVALNVVGVNLITPVLPSYANHFDVGIAAASFLITVFAIARMSARLPAGSLADRFGSRIVCMGGASVQAFGALLATVAPGLAVLLIARAIQGVGSALFGTSANRYLLVVTDKAELGRAIASFQGGIVLGGTIGPLIGGVVAQQFGIFAPFYVQAGLAIALLIVSGFVIDRHEGPEGVVGSDKAARPTLRQILAIPGFQVVMFGGFSVFFVRAGGINVVVPAFGDSILSMSPAAIGAVISLGSVVSLVVMPLAGRLADSRSRWEVAVGGALMTAITVALFGVVENEIQFFAIAALSGIGIGFVAVALPTMIGDLAPPGTEGRASGVYRMANDMGWIFGPITLALLADQSRYGLAFLVAGVPLLLAAAVLSRSRSS
ncbi:MAG: DHA1 family multidrug resistance protein-like MFS transporter [Verrucomicrobiales bacterium]|jgi:DHA1 family multidrug resistance protein-like MFS transporter